MIAIIDADLIGRDKHRFPNLVCEKLSAYWKEKGETVALKLDYENLDKYSAVYISKVFTDTWVPEWIAENVDMDKGTVSLPANINVGGTGFFFAHAPKLPDEIEHHMPDYHLYDDWIATMISGAKREHDEKEEAKFQKSLQENIFDENGFKVIYEKKKFNESYYKIQFKEYTDYSIGFMTRGCFRKCPFCVNQVYSKVHAHSPLEEFYDPSRKKICLLDDNFLGGPDWKRILNELIATGKPFKFKQGMDERLLTDERCEMLFNANYDGDYTFAFDNVEDYDVIHQKLKLIRKYAGKASIKFYVLVGFRGTDDNDIDNCFKRIQLLFKYGCLPYVMRYQNKNETPWKNSTNRALYVTIARWANQPSIVKKMSFRQFCEANQALHKNKMTYCSSMKSMIEIESRRPDLAEKYFDMRFEEPDKIVLKGD